MADKKRKSILGGAGEKEFASWISLRINDRRADKFHNEYLNLLERGKSEGESKTIIMNKIKALKIPLGELNVRKS